MSLNRRLKRKAERDVKKGINNNNLNLRLPTEEELEEYILNKSRDLRVNPINKEIKEIQWDVTVNNEIPNLKLE